MNYIVINGYSTSEDVKSFKEIFTKLSGKDKAIYASVNYEYPIPDEDAAYLKYPLIIYTNDEYAFCIRNVTAGYGWQGPRGMVECLKLAGFEFDENLIFNHQPQGVKLSFQKGDVILCPENEKYPYSYPKVCYKKNKCHWCTVCK